MIDRTTKDRILAATRIEEVVGDFIALKRRGANWWGICPFHQDKRPSLAVSPSKGIFKCFACGESGNAVSFVMKHEHLTYAESLKYLAKKYHIEVVEKEETPEEIASRLKHESLLVVSEFAQKYFQDILWNDANGRAIGLSYFHERKFTDETIRKFGLGYTPTRPHTLTKDALAKGYKEEYLVDAGLCIRRDDGSVVDKFYDRVMFPIYSISGRVIAFGGRTLKSDKSIAKYVNTAGTEIYNKSESLYGIFQAKNAIIKADKCILVEGYADVISMHQQGIQNVVASSGTSLTTGQIRLIKRFTSNITIIYDGDAAGIKAAVRGTNLVLEEGLNVRIVVLPPEDDPDTFAQARSTTEILEYLAENERDFISFKSDLAEADMAADPLSRSKLINDIIGSIAVIPDAILRKEYAEMVAERFRQEVEDILSKITAIRDEQKRQAQLRERSLEAQVPPALSGQNAAEGDFGLEPVSDLPQEMPPAPEETNPYLLTNPVLAVQERELTDYLLRFGSYPLHFEKDMLYGAAPAEQINVETYIRNTLLDDDIVFANRLYRELYDEYFSFAGTLPVGMETRERQEAIAHHFANLENQTLLRESLNIVFDDQELTVRVYRDTLEPEEQRLGETVPKSVIMYKLRITEQQCAEITRAINSAQREGDQPRQRELAKTLSLLNKVKLQLSKELRKGSA